MGPISFLISQILYIYTYILLIRIIIELIRNFSRQFRPPRWFYLVAEPIFIVTDPPLKALRKIIPPVRMGNGVALDLSVLVLFFIISALASLVGYLHF